MITNLVLRAHIGVRPEERNQLQDIIVNMRCEMDAEGAMVSDAIVDTVNYRECYEQCHAIVRERTFALLEALAGAIAEAMFQHAHVRNVVIRVEKPKKFPGIDAVGVEFTRCRVGVQS
ncbi:dihydroneopterin aldolase [Candidatus Uhrbacteria bacterium]|nr:dihydroneopterin aldolase [Candidatus Uhrbacteria bacterium]